MKTRTPEEIYADELYYKFYDEISFLGLNNWFSISKKKAIKCAIIDVQNTIEAIEKILLSEYGHTKMDIGQSYYQEVLTILKTK